jgi:DNA-binding CsgD family transcriptional regulator/PAS domain-containing protein
MDTQRASKPLAVLYRIADLLLHDVDAIQPTLTRVAELLLDAFRRPSMAQVTCAGAHHARAGFAEAGTRLTRAAPTRDDEPVIVEVLGPAPFAPEEEALVEYVCGLLAHAVDRHRRRSRLATVLNAVGAGTWELDLREGIVRPSDEMRRLAEPMALTYAAFEDIVHPEDLARVRADVAEARKGDGWRRQSTYRVVMADGAVRWHTSTLQTVRDRSGIAERMQGLTVDTTWLHHSSRGLPDLLQQRVDELCARSRLTPREREVLQLLLLGRTDSDIATAVGITSRTARFHASNVLGKLGADSRLDLFRILLH